MISSKQSLSYGGWKKRRPTSEWGSKIIMSEQWENEAFVFQREILVQLTVVAPKFHLINVHSSKFWVRG